MVGKVQHVPSVLAFGLVAIEYIRGFATLVWAINLLW